MNQKNQTALPLGACLVVTVHFFSKKGGYRVEQEKLGTEDMHTLYVPALPLYQL